MAVSKQHLITITTSYHGLDYIVHAQAMDRWLNVCDPSKPADQQEHSATSPMSDA